MAGLVVGRPHHQPCCLYPYEARPCQSKGGRPTLTLAGIVVVSTHHYPRLDGRSDTNHQHTYTTCLSGAAQRRDVPNLAAPGPHIRGGQAILTCIGGVDARHLGLEQRKPASPNKGGTPAGQPVAGRPKPQVHLVSSRHEAGRPKPRLLLPSSPWGVPKPSADDSIQVKTQENIIKRRELISHSG